MKRFATFLLALLLLCGFTSLADAQTISFTATVKNSSGGNISGATIIQAGNPSITTASDASGNFTLTGLPSGTPFSLKISTQGFVDLYSGVITSSNNVTSPRPFTLYSTAEVSQWNIIPGKGVITSRVTDQNSPQTNIGGAVASATSGLHPATPYTIVYLQDQGPPAGTSTATNGKFMVLNVDDGDTVTVTATKEGWTFGQRTFVTHANSISQSALAGTQDAPSPAVSLTATVATAGPSPAPIAGAAIEMVGNPSVSTTSDESGSFVLSGLPSGAAFSLKISKTDFVPTYTHNMNPTSNSTSPRPYVIFTSDQLSGLGGTPGKGVIAGWVSDNANKATGYIGGATVSFTSALYPSSPPYTAVYRDNEGNIGGTSTSSNNAAFYILNIDDGDTVTVTASKSGYTFTTKTYTAHADSLSQGGIFGTASADPNIHPLSAGWNFVSFPKQPPSTAIATVLAALLSDVSVVWGFDNELQTWKKYVPSDGGSTLTSIEQGKGYWVFMKNQGFIDMTSWAAGSTTVHLYAGWNLVGYSGTGGASVSTSLASVSGWQVIWTWASGTWKAETPSIELPIPPVTSLRRGVAYWVKMTEGVNADWSQ